MDIELQIHWLLEGGRVTSTYTRADLGIETAVVVGSPDGRWAARLIDGPEAEESSCVTFASEAGADRAATVHSLSF